MAAIQTSLQEVVQLTSAQYQELITNGSITVSGITVTYSDNTLYATPDGGVPVGLNSNIVVVSDGNGNAISSGVTTGELNALTNVRSNIQQQIDNLASQIGTAGASNYFVNSLEEIEAQRDQPGNYYIDNGNQTYTYYVVDDNGKILLINSKVPESEVVKTDLAGYQKKADASILVTYSETNSTEGQTKGEKVGTVVGAINELDKEMGDAFPLATTAKTVSAAINELAAKQGANLSGINGITVSTNTATGITTIGHTANTKISAKTYGSVGTGVASLPLITTDAQGHVTSDTTLKTVYIPSSKGTTGQVWSWDAANDRGAWATMSTSGTYTASKGIKLDGIDIRHENENLGKDLGDDTDALKLTIDDQGHVATALRPDGSAGQYIASNWEWTDPIGNAQTILDGDNSERLVTSAAINDIMGGMRIRKCTQADYDGGDKRSDTIYIIVG